MQHRRTRQHLKSRAIRIETLESRRVLASISLVQQPPIISADHAGPQSVVASDIDGDGDLDLVAASSLDHRVGWYPNLDGQGNFGDASLVSDQALGATMVRTADLDGDGDLDIVAALYAADKVVWYENLDEKGDFSSERVITELAIFVSAIAVADIDGDGAQDVISISSGPYDSDVSWYRNDGDGAFGGQRIITANVVTPSAVEAADVDGDGDADVLSSSYSDDKVAWYENVDGQGTFGDQKIISDQFNGASEVIAADVDGDGDMDAVAGSAYSDGVAIFSEIAWFENTDGNGSFGSPQAISRFVDGVESLAADDLDGDGDLDLVAASFYDDQVAWFENLDGNGIFGVQQPISLAADGPTEAITADLDGDGDRDLVIASFHDDSVAWIANTDGRGAFSGVTVISQFGTIGVESLRAADLDGDGDLDALTASLTENSFTWYENIDGAGGFGAPRTIDANAAGAISIEPADLDGDGDLDVLGSSTADSTVAWYENTDGQGTFSGRRLITDALPGTETSTAADLDGDGDLDVVAAATSRNDSSVVWFENQGGGCFGSANLIWNQIDAPREIKVADLDEDNDVDIIVASTFDNTISWFENTDGRGTFSDQKIVSIDVALPLAIEIADLDGDSHLDIVATSFLFGPIPDERTSRIVFFANPAGDANFAPERTIAIGPTGLESVDVADLDGDGDQDVVAGFIVDDRISWFENLDGKGEFGPEHVIDRFEPGDVEVADLDGDGDGDLLASLYIASRVTWYRNEPDRAPGDFSGDGQVTAEDVDLLCAQIGAADHQAAFDLTGDERVDRQDLEELIGNIAKTTFGDANLDGVFNSTDLIAVFRAGEYDDGIAGNSTWGEGDWNCDGEFDTSDLVAAFQDGGYESAVGPAVAASIEFQFQFQEDDKRRTGRR